MERERLDAGWAPLLAVSSQAQAQLQVQLGAPASRTLAPAPGARQGTGRVGGAGHHEILADFLFSQGPPATSHYLVPGLGKNILLVPGLGKNILGVKGRALVPAGREGQQQVAWRRWAGPPLAGRALPAAGPGAGDRVGCWSGAHLCQGSGDLGWKTGGSRWLGDPELGQEGGEVIGDG